VVSELGLLSVGLAGVTVAPDGEIWVASWVPGHVVRVDPVNGAQSLGSSAIGHPSDLHFDRQGRLLALDAFGSLGPDALVELEVATGAATPLSVDGLLGYPFGLSEEPDGQVVIGDLNAGILRVDPVTGQQTSLLGGRPIRRLVSIRALCEDGLDNDGDGLVDAAVDPGCSSSTSLIEDPQCQDGLDNDGDGRIDFDGGASIHGVPVAPPDLQCASASGGRESAARSCGLGFELAALIPGLLALRTRRLAARR